MQKQVPEVVWPVGYTTAVRSVERARAALEKAQTALDAVRKNAAIRCAKCEAIHPIAEQTYIQTHWYTSPYGCNGGDYWNLGEGQWICPSCGFYNRFEDCTERACKLFYKPEIVALKKFFAKVEDRFDR